MSANPVRARVERMLRAKERAFDRLIAVDIGTFALYTLKGQPGLFKHGLSMEEGEKVVLDGDREALPDTNLIAASGQEFDDPYSNSPNGYHIALRAAGKGKPEIRASEAAQITAAEKFRDDFNGWRVVAAVESKTGDVYAKPPSGYEAGLTALRSKRGF